MKPLLNNKSNNNNNNPEPSITLSKPLEDYTNPSKIVIILSEGLCNAC